MNARFDDLISLAALGELTDAEAIELEWAANHDERVAEDLADALATAAALQASTRQPPPASMRASVLDSIANIEQESARPAFDALPEATPGVVSVVSTAPIPMEQAHRRRFAPVLAAAAALLLVVGGAVLVTSNDSGSNDPIAAVVDADDASTRQLDGELGESLIVAYSPSEGALVVVGNDVPALVDDQTYQLWLIDSNGARSVGVFRPDDTGRVEQRFDGSDPSGLALGVTREPAGGSDQPTLPILASA